MQRGYVGLQKQLSENLKHLQSEFSYQECTNLLWVHSNYLVYLPYSLAVAVLDRVRNMITLLGRNC